MGIMDAIMGGARRLEDFGGSLVDEPTDPIVRAANTPEGRLILKGLSYVDVPRKISTDVVGAADYYRAMLAHQVGLEDTADWQNIKQNYESGGGLFGGGGRNVWENQIVADLAPWQRGLLDVAVDPLTYAPFVGWAGKGLEGAGIAARTAEEAGLGAKALGYGLEGTGKIVKGVGAGLYGANNIQNKAFEVATKPLTWPLGKVAERTPLGRLAQLSAGSQDKKFVDEVTRHGGIFLAGEEQHPEATRAAAAGGHGLNVLKQVRNSQYTDPASRTTQQAGQRASHILGISATGGQDILGLPKPPGAPEMVDVAGDRVPRWTSEHQRNAAVDYAAYLMQSEAPLQTEYQGLQGAMQGLNNFRHAVITNLGSEYTDLVPDIYRALYDRSKPGEMPEPVFAGERALGGGVTDYTNPGEVDRHGASYAAAQMQLSREGGTVQQFRPGGAYYQAKGGTPADLRDIINNGGVGEEGLKLLSRDEFADIWRQHVGAQNATPEDVDRYWNAGLDLWYKRMLEAAKPWIDSTKESRAKTQVQLLPNRAEMQRQIDKGMAGAGFYEGNLVKLRAAFSSDSDYDLFLQFMAAGSPRNGVTQNAKDAFRHWVDYKASNVAALKAAGFTDQDLQDIGRSSVGLQNDMETRRALFQQVQRGDPLESQKVGSFYANYREATRADQFRNAFGQSDEQQRLLDEVLQSERLASGAATMDSHHARAMSLGDTYDNPTYQMQEQAVNQVAHEMGLSPREAQAAIWLTSKGEQGFVSQDDPIQKQVLQHIANTPVEKVDLGSGEIGTFGATTMQEALGPQIHQRVQDWFDKATDAASVAVHASSAKGGAVLLTPDLKLYEGTRRDVMDKARKSAEERLGPAMWQGSEGEGFTAQVKGGRTIKEAAGRKLQAADFDPLYGKDGVVLASMRVDSTDTDAVSHAIVKFKLGLQDAFNQDWGSFRIAVNSDTADGSTKINALYFPRSTHAMHQLASIADTAVTAAHGDWRLMSEVAPVTAQSLILADRSLTPGGGWNTVSSAANLKKWLTPELERIQSGTSPGATFEPVPGTQGSIQFRKMQDFPLNPDGSHQKAVALTSAGVKGVLAPDSKQATAEISAFLKEAQPVMQSRSSSLVKFGLFHDDASGVNTFDLTIPALNAREADEIGSLTNQISYYDPDLGENVPVSGGAHNSDSPFKTPEQVKRLLDAIQTARENGTTITAALEGPATVPPWASGIAAGQQRTELASRLAGAVMASPEEKLGALTNAPGLSGIGRFFQRKFSPWTPAKSLGTDAFENAKNLDVQMLSDPRLVERPWLSQQTSDAMFNNTLEDGTTYGDYLQKVAGQVQYIKQKAQMMGVSYERGLEPEKRAALFGDKYDKAIVRDLGKMHQDPLYSTPQEVALNSLQFKILKERGHEVERQGTYHLLRSAWSEVALLSPRYQTSNIFTNALNAALDGHAWAALQGVKQLPVFVRGEVKGGGIEHIQNAKLYDFLVDTGQGQINQALNTGHRNLIGEGIGRSSAVRRIVNRVGLKNWGWVGKPFELNAAVAQGVDNSARSALLQDAFDHHWYQNVDELYGKLTAAAEKGGLNPGEGDIDLLPNRNPKYLYEYYKGLGVEDGYAKRMSNDVAELVNKGTDDAIKNHVDRVYLNYYRTNADEIISKVVPFHYWASRMVRFYGEEALRNPALIANWYRMENGMDRLQNDAGLNARQKGFVKLMSGLTGFTLLMNPDALMGVIKATGIGDQYTPDGETEVGHIARLMKSNGVGLFPWFDGVLNMMGTYGDTFEPDMLGIRHRALVGASINWLRGEGVFGASNENPGAAPYADLNDKARAAVSSWTSTFLPDWLSQPVPVQAGGTAGQVSLDKIIENRIMAENPTLTNAELVTIMNNPDDPKYQSAFKDAARAGIIGQLLSFTLPSSFKERENSSDVRAATNTLVRQEADKLGVAPQDVTPDMTDLQFRATYKNQTGKEFQAGDWQDAADKRDLTFATPEGRQFVLMDNEYKQLGSPAAKQAQKTYYGIIDGTAQVAQLGDLTRLTPDQRQSVADQWLNTQSGASDEIRQMRSLQDAYKQTHPEYAAFKDWQTQIGNVAALYGGSLAEYRRLVSQQNPNAAAYFQAVIQDLRKRGVPQDQWIEKLDQATYSSNLWFEVTGRSQSRYDPAAQPNTNDPSAQLSGMVDQYTQPAQQQVTWDQFRQY